MFCASVTHKNNRSYCKMEVDVVEQSAAAKPSMKQQIEEQLSIALFDKICRACLSSEDIAYIFETSYNDVGLWEIFKNSAAVQIEQYDNMPQNICKSCIGILIQMHVFKQRCRRSDALLREAVARAAHQEDLHAEATFDEAGEAVTSDAKLEDVVEVQSSKHHDLMNGRKKAEDVKRERRRRRRLKQEKHPRSRNYMCSECYKPFSYSHLQQHMRTHTKEKPFRCQVCQVQFSLKCNLRRHMMIHTGERPHTCEICSKGFIQATTLADHKRTHTGETPFICSYCGIGFGQSSRYKAHLKRHSIENGNRDKSADGYKCNVCHRFFTTRGILKTHMLTHGEKTFLCSQCGKGFVSNAGLLSHMKVHTGVKPYPCTVCSKSFSQLGSLKSHMLIHTGQKPFVCKVCAKAFTQRNHLKYHMRTHSGERPYECGYCGKSFALKGTLTIHIRTHTGETPYVCDVCGKGFYDSSSMKKHKRGHGQFDDKVIVLVDSYDGGKCKTKF